MTNDQIDSLFDNPRFVDRLLQLFGNETFARIASQAMISAKTANRIEYGVTGLCFIAQRFNADKQKQLRSFIEARYQDGWFKSRDVKHEIERICKDDIRTIDFDKKDLAWVEVGHVMLKCFRDGMVDKRMAGGNVTKYRLK